MAATGAQSSVDGRVDAALMEGIRDVTDDEVTFFQKNGWVKLDGLITSELAASFLRAAQEQDLTEGPAHRYWGRIGIGLEGGVEPFRSLALNERLGRNAQRLINRRRLMGVDVPVRCMTDILGRLDPGGIGAVPHQDFSGGADRVGGFMLWIALDEVTPEMGAMRFLTGSHREGPLGSARDGHVIDRYPNLEELYEASPPFHYRPGDATAHNGFMVHYGPQNVSEKQRWSYIIGYMSADVQVLNIPGEAQSDVKSQAQKIEAARYRKNGMWRLMDEDDERHPIVCR